MSIQQRLKQHQEIDRDPALRMYFYFLVLVHFFTALFWFKQGLVKIISWSTESYCWPGLAGCDAVKDLLSPFSSWILPLYLLLIAVVMLQSDPRRRWWGLLSLEIFKAGIQFLDYRFMGNYHFMPHIVTLTYLFVPQKRFWIRVWLVTFYVAAASLKLNFEWLSGASLSWRVPFGNYQLLQISAWVVLLMEFIVPWWLLSSERKWKVAALIILAIFHAVSYYWVGFFYPAVMTSLLAFWILDEKLQLIPAIGVRVSTGWTRPEITWPFFWGSLPWFVFVFFQIHAFANPKEVALGGTERLFNLNMFDARSDCHGVFFVHDGKTITEVSFKNEHFAVRVKCDPILFREQGRRLCSSRQKPEGAIEAHLISRRWTDREISTIIKEKDICRKSL